jgi:hypothetical protein
MYKKQSNYHYEEFQLNSDGTTLAQRKIGAATINGMVVSVNELANGSAEQIAKDITKEFKNLREIAQALGLDNADSINWSLVTSSTSDSASTQKKFNEIAKQKKREDMDRFDTNTKNGEELIANFCAMHLGVNLRKAFIEGSTATAESTAKRQYAANDTFIHEF